MVIVRPIKEHYNHNHAVGVYACWGPLTAIWDYKMSHSAKTWGTMVMGWCNDRVIGLVGGGIMSLG